MTELLFIIQQRKNGKNKELQGERGREEAQLISVSHHCSRSPGNQSTSYYRVGISVKWSFGHVCPHLRSI